MRASEIARRVIESGAAPACVAGCATRDRFETGGETGDLGLFFDLASVTKPFTAVAVARSGMGLAAPLESFVPELRGTRSGGCPLVLLLAHRAGLKSHLPIYEPLTRGEAVDPARALQVIANARREDAEGEFPRAGFAPIYSDLGYILAGVALARHTKTQDAGEAIARLVIGPFGLTGSIGTARDLKSAGISLMERVAPTEVVPWRGGEIRGVVHDENAWALTGEGGSGHAGLFGTIDGVLHFGREVLSRIGELGWLVEERPGGTLRAGFDGKSAIGSSAGERPGPRTFGHLGFTGTSIWIDPD
ncbi:MAG: serine hydrolase domain-containing protein, partial [Polyangiaceae bacterium]